jgi:predicted ATPase
MIRSVRIHNYKSILDHTLELGRVNVFIGENGCGKTNLLEAIAMASASVAGKLDAEELYSKGVRIAKPSTTFSSFVGMKQKLRIELVFDFKSSATGGIGWKCTIESRDPQDITAEWVDREWNPSDGGAYRFEITFGKNQEEPTKKRRRNYAFASTVC